MKRLLTITATLSLSVLALAGCTTSETLSDHSMEFTKKLSDGRTVTCISGQGLSCDWENAR